MRLGYGYARRGQRLITHAPLRKGKRLSLLGRLGHDGSGAVAMHEASVRRSHFRGFIREHLLPHLKPGDVVLWDNARIHNRTIVRCAPEIGYLMRYPIWSKLKHWIRKAQAETSANGGRGVGGITRECFRCRGLVCALRIPPSMELTAAIPQHGPLPYPFSLTHKIRYVIGASSFGHRLIPGTRRNPTRKPGRTSCLRLCSMRLSPETCQVSCALLPNGIRLSNPRHHVAPMAATTAATTPNTTPFKNV